MASVKEKYDTIMRFLDRIPFTTKLYKTYFIKAERLQDMYNSGNSTIDFQEFARAERYLKEFEDFGLARVSRYVDSKFELTVQVSVTRVG